MTGYVKANGLRRAAMIAAAAAVLCLPAGWAQSHKQSAPPPAQHSQPQQHTAPVQHTQSHPESPARSQPRTYTPPPNAQPRPSNVPPQTYTPARTLPPNQYNQPQPANQAQHYFAPHYEAAAGRPAYPGYRSPATAPPGHLQSWLDQHRNVPVANKEQMLRSDPSFKQLPQGEQQRLVQQLQHVDGLSDQQRERRLARAENLEAAFAGGAAEGETARRRNGGRCRTIGRR